jgi:uncharacterized protein (TIGR03000 family)
MLHRRLLMVLAGALVSVVSPLAARPVLGQGAGGYYYETYRYGYKPGYYARRYTAPPVFGAPSKLAPTTTPYVYYVPAEVSAPKVNRAPTFMIRSVTPAATPTTAGVPVQIDLQVPADARVWFDGEKTSQTGTQRQFVTPPLIQGREYTYEVRAAWKEGGRDVTESRHLSFRAGDRVSAPIPAAAQIVTVPPAGNAR